MHRAYHFKNGHPKIVHWKEVHVVTYAGPMKTQRNIYGVKNNIL